MRALVDHFAAFGGRAAAGGVRPAEDGRAHVAPRRRGDRVEPDLRRRWRSTWGSGSSCAGRTAHSRRGPSRTWSAGSRARSSSSDASSTTRISRAARRVAPRGQHERPVAGHRRDAAARSARSGPPAPAARSRPDELALRIPIFVGPTGVVMHEGHQLLDAAARRSALAGTLYLYRQRVRIVAGRFEPIHPRLCTARRTLDPARAPCRSRSPRSRASAPSATCSASICSNSAARLSTTSPSSPTGGRGCGCAMSSELHELLARHGDEASALACRAPFAHGAPQPRSVVRRRVTSARCWTARSADMRRRAAPQRELALSHPPRG